MTRELREALERAADLSEDQQRFIAFAVLRHIEVARKDHDQPRQLRTRQQDDFIDFDRGIPVFRVPRNAPTITSEDVGKALHDDF